MEKKYKKVYRILAFLCVGLLVTVIAMIAFNSRSRSSSMEVVGASAEEVSAQTIEDYNVSDYPSANLIPFPYYESNVTKDGLTMTVNSDGTFRLFGTNTRDGYVSFELCCDLSLLSLVEDQYYTISSGISNPLDYGFGLFFAFGTDSVGQSQGTFQWKVEKGFRRIYCSVAKGKTVDLLVKPMLNVGETAYPFIPYLGGVYENGFNSAMYGQFSGATIKGTYQRVGGSGSTSFEVSPIMSNQGASLGSVYDYLMSQKNSQDIYYVSWGLYFSVPVPFQILGLGLIAPENYVKGTVDEYVLYNATINYSGSSYAVKAMFDSQTERYGYRAKFGGSDLSFSAGEALSSWAWDLVSVTGFVTTTMEDFKKIQFVGPDTSSYTSGYNKGFAEGRDDMYQDLQEKANDYYLMGLSEGKVLGYDQGYSEGFMKGTGDDPYSLADFMFAFLDMPGRILYNFLNFEFFGVNLAGLVATFLTVFAVGWVFSKVK